MDDNDLLSFLRSGAAGDIIRQRVIYLGVIPPQPPAPEPQQYLDTPVSER